MRVRNRNGANAAERRDQRFGCRIKISDAVPQDIALRGSQENGPLIDGKRRNGFEADELRLQLLLFVGVRGGQRVEIDPRLPRGGNVLTLILADWTSLGLRNVRGSTGFTECNHAHFSAIKL